jgi:CHAT domain-containing protein/tetratricopeptide (TPR) repeat protein
VGVAFDGVLRPGEVHSFDLPLSSGEFAQVVADQRGVDLEIKLLSPDRSLLARIDRPSGPFGPETASLIAEESGVYQVQLCHFLNARTTDGSYKVRVASVRPGVAADARRIDAERALSEGERLRDKGNAVSIQNAVAQFERGARLWASLNEDFEEAIGRYGFGWSCNMLGEYQKAIPSFRRSLELGKGLNDPWVEALAISGIGWSLLYIGDPEQALPHFARSLELRHGLGDTKGEGITLYGIGWCQSLMENDRQALESFNESLKIRQALNDKRGEALTLSGLGDICRRLGRGYEALTHLSRAIEMLREAGHKYGEANALSSMGWALSALGRYDEALETFDKALSLRREVGDRAGEAATLFGMGKTQGRKGELGLARETMKLALLLIESLRAGGSSIQLRTYYFASVQEYYEFYIDVLMRLHRERPSAGYAAEALQASERARARSLLDLLVESRADIREGIDPHLLERRTELQRKLSLVAGRQRQSFLGGKAESAALSQELALLATQLEELETEVRSLSPRFAALTQPEMLSVAGIQSLLDSETLLLEYSLGDRQSYLWVVGAGTFNSYELPPRAEIESTASLANKLLTARNDHEAGETSSQWRDRVRRSEAQYEQVARRLSRMILGPVAGLLARKRLVFIAPGKLQLVSFAALPDPTGDVEPAVEREAADPRGLGGGPEARSDFVPMLENHEIGYAASASILALLRVDRRQHNRGLKTLAMFADPVFSKDDERITATSRRRRQRATATASVTRAGKSGEMASGPGESLDFGLPRLFATRTEAEQIASLVAHDERMIAMSFAANRDRAMSGELGRYRNVHFATHSIIDSTHPVLSAVALSLVDKNGKAREGFLRMHEIFNLRLSAELVTLSGCRSGLGKEIKGEGLMALTRAFMYAGAPRVAVSLWSLDDTATASLMVRFYRKLFGPDHPSPAAALRLAQLEMRRESRWQSPYYWAGFVLQGEWR